MNILALAPYPERIASTRFRVSRYLPHLARLGMHVEFVPWLDDATARELYQPGRAVSKAAAAASGLVRQLRGAAKRWDAVWIQREVALAGPPVVEALALARGLPIVLDYDDAVWLAQGSALRRAAKFSWKFDWILRRASHALAGSQTLAARARNAGVPTTVLPTVVERATWTPRQNRDHAGPLLIGWVGTHSTASQLALAAPALRRLRAEGHAFRVLVVGAAPGFGLDGLVIEQRPWRLDREVDDFRSLDIGLTPMGSSEWHEGKCGFKQVQLMAVGVPFVSSLVGGARDFLVNEENALIARTPDDWYRQLRRLMTSAALRDRLGRTGRQLVETRLCVESQTPALAEAFRSASRAPQPSPRTRGASRT